MPKAIFHLYILRVCCIPVQLYFLLLSAYLGENCAIPTALLLIFVFMVWRFNPVLHDLPEKCGLKKK